MAETVKKNNALLRVILIVIVLLALVWAMRGSDLVEENDDVDGGPREAICVNNGGTWDDDTQTCITDEEEIPAAVDTGDIEPIVEPEDENPVEGDDDNIDDGVIINSSGEVVVD